MQLFSIVGTQNTCKVDANLRALRSKVPAVKRTSSSLIPTVEALQEKTRSLGFLKSLHLIAVTHSRCPRFCGGDLILER